ncbi:FMN-binding protein [Sulfurimonas sp. HSL1-6]|uniref:FMN-binding protein n=1 Tax=Thiomicrolovo immobilis TaxID=3131935 RepID=UPI0031F82C55
MTLILLSVGAAAAPLISPIDAMQHAFGAQSEVTKKNTLLSSKQAAAVTKRAKLKLETKIYRFYTAVLDGKTVGYGVLVTRQVRQKDATVLYMITPEGTIRAIEIIAFNEPPEYMPQHPYLEQFRGKDANATLRVGKDIPTVSGATLSARNVTDGARLALALFETAIRKH